MPDDNDKLPPDGADQKLPVELTDTPSAAHPHSQLSQGSKAKDRLNQVTGHLYEQNRDSNSSSNGDDSSNRSRPRTKPRRRQRPKTQQEALPPDYSDILCQISSLKTIANTPDPTNRGYIRQKEAGKLWVRERITKFLDRDSFREIGPLAGTVAWETVPGTNTEKPISFTPSNNPQGHGTLTCPRTKLTRKVLLTADDFSIRSGHADGAHMEKTLSTEKLALKLKVPIIKLVDGSSGGGSVTTIKANGWSYIPDNAILAPAVQALNLGIPNLGAVLGPAIGLGAARVVSTHFSVMAGSVGSLFNAGPKVVAGATFEEDLSFAELGGPGVHCCNGTIDNLAADEEGAFEQLRVVLGYLPSCGMLEGPPVVRCEDPVGREDLGLRSVVPRRKGRMYNPYRILVSVLDSGSWFEIGGLWGRVGITGLGRLGGRPVGVVSNNCEVNGGALDAASSQKLARFLKFCDVFNLPLLQFVDIPGYAIGTVAERTATMRWGVQLATAYYSTTMPIFSVITRKVYGVAGGVMHDSRDPCFKVAWPSGQWGSLPLDGGIEVGHRHELREAERNGGMEARKTLYKELEDEYLRLMNPVRTANAFGVEDIIDPKDTRKVVCEWAEMAYGMLMKERLADRASGKIKPMFT